MKIWLRAFAIFAMAIILDWLTKQWAEQTLQLHQPMPFIGQFFRFTLGHNTGVAFGLFAQGGPWPLVVTGLIIVGLAVWFANALHTGEFPRSASWLVGLILGGAVGNFSDRLLDGRVTDFLDVGLGQARWPTFNLADSFIMMGLVTLMLSTLEQERRKQAIHLGETEDFGYE